MHCKYMCIITQFNLHDALTTKYQNSWFWCHYLFPKISSKGPAAARKENYVSLICCYMFLIDHNSSQHVDQTIAEKTTRTCEGMLFVLTRIETLIYDTGRQKWYWKVYRNDMKCTNKTKHTNRTDRTTNSRRKMRIIREAADHQLLHVGAKTKKNWIKKYFIK